MNKVLQVLVKAICPVGVVGPGFAAPIGILMLVFSRNALDFYSLGHVAVSYLIIPSIILFSLSLFLSACLYQGSVPSYCLFIVAAVAAVVPIVTGLEAKVNLAFLFLAGLFSIMGVTMLVLNNMRKKSVGNEQNRVMSHDVSPPLVSNIQAPLTYKAETARYSYLHVVGMSELKSRLSEVSQEIVSSKMTGKDTRNGILFNGDPGNGKTFIAQALAGELRLPIVSVSFSDLASRWVNQTSEQVRQVFQDARKQAPCVLFIDEVDSLLSDRSASMDGGGETAKTTNVLLTELVNIRNAGVIVIAATNYIEKLDAAAIRDGRFDFKIEIPNPDAEARTGIIRQSLGKTPGISIDLSALQQATKRWDGFSVARIRAAVDEAGRNVAKSGKRVVEYTDLQVGLRTVQGRKGSLPADTPTLMELSMPEPQKSKLTGIGARMLDIELIEEQGGSVPTGMMFFGPPGTGKTLTARALAKTSNWAFLPTCGADLLSDQKAIDRLLKDARDMRPCIVFIDEADDVCADRQYSGQHVCSITNKLLTAMEGASGKANDVLWIAATNHPENMDPAIQRRLVEKIEFLLPDECTLTTFISNWVGTSKARFDVDVAYITQVVTGLSIAIVKDVLQQSVNCAVGRNLAGARIAVACVGAQDIDAAVDAVTGRNTV